MMTTRNRNINTVITTKFFTNQEPNSFINKFLYFCQEFGSCFYETTRKKCKKFICIYCRKIGTTRRHHQVLHNVT